MGREEAHWKVLNILSSSTAEYKAVGGFIMTNIDLMTNEILLELEGTPVMDFPEIAAEAGRSIVERIEKHVSYVECLRKRVIFSPDVQSMANDINLIIDNAIEDAVLMS